MGLIQWYERPMAITVRELVETSHVGNRFHAGRSGSEQVINWADSCEMPDPWRWLEPFDMLMTNGIGIPDDPDHQVRIHRPSGRCRDQRDRRRRRGRRTRRSRGATVSAADRRALPILLTAYEIPFAAVARVVAEARTDAAERHRLMKTARIHESLRAATIEGREGSSLLDELSAELARRLAVLDVATGRDVFMPQQRLGTTTLCLPEGALEPLRRPSPRTVPLDVDGDAALLAR